MWQGVFRVYDRMINGFPPREMDSIAEETNNPSSHLLTLLVIRASSPALLRVTSGTAYHGGGRGIFFYCLKCFFHFTKAVDNR